MSKSMKMLDTSRLTEEEKELLIKQWVETLDVAFGGNDFWRLSKRWKRKHYYDIAKMIVDDVSLIESGE
jgi:hypothetical protein